MSPCNELWIFCSDTEASPACIAASGILDYFGATVNLAARAQPASDCDAVALTRAMLDTTGLQHLLAGQ